VDVARRRRRAPALLARRRPVRRRAAPRRRRRGRRVRRGARPGRGRGHLRRLGADARAHGHDPHRGRRQGLAHAPRPAPRPSRRVGRGGRPDRRPGLLRRDRARRAVRPPRRPRERRDVRRSPVPASVAGGLPSASARGAARAFPSGPCARAASACDRASGRRRAACRAGSCPVGARCGASPARRAAADRGHSSSSRRDRQEHRARSTPRSRGARGRERGEPGRLAPHGASDRRARSRARGISPGSARFADRRLSPQRHRRAPGRRSGPGASARLAETARGRRGAGRAGCLTWVAARCRRRRHGRSARARRGARRRRRPARPVGGRSRAAPYD
jgi:hypothetical protein